MTISTLPRSRQRGAALLIVLLFVATLSFLALGFAEAMKQSVRIGAGGAARGVLLWRAASLEVLAQEALREAKRIETERGGKFTSDHPLFAVPFTVPMPDGEGSIRFADATRCFNLNSLVTANGFQRQLNETAVRELEHIAQAIGLGRGEAEKIAHVVADWIDDDTVQEISGAEDGFYGGLPTPFRTGSTLIADVSELRAMEGVSAPLYQALRPYICAHPTTEPAQVNVNMLRAEDAPILVGLTDGAVSRVAASDIIAAAPPGGWDTIEAFWAQKALADAEIGPQIQQNRTALTSRYLTVRGRASLNEFDIGVRLFFRLRPDDDELSLISREIGAPG